MQHRKGRGNKILCSFSLDFLIIFCCNRKGRGKESKILPEEIKKNKPNAVEYSEITAVRKLLANPILAVYHGNKDKNIIPTYKGENDGRNGTEPGRVYLL